MSRKALPLFSICEKKPERLEHEKKAMRKKEFVRVSNTDRGFHSFSRACRRTVSTLRRHTFIISKEGEGKREKLIGKPERTPRKLEVKKRKKKM